MAMWPFRRRGHSREPRASTALDTDSIRERPDRATIRRQTVPQNRLTKPNDNQARSYSFSPGRRDSIRYSRAPNEATSRSNVRRKSKKHVSMPVTPTNDDQVHRAPTLHHENSGSKRSGQPLLAKKSSKRRKEDHEREAEIRAMSQQFSPARPATDAWTKGRPMKKDSRRFRSGLARDWDEQPSSVVSLPSPASIHSSMSSDSDHISFKVSALSALAPRPTIRYSSNPVSGSGLGRSPSDKKRLADREPISEATLKAHKRIDDLADDLDASDLRELMERDQRRRHRKREKEMQRAERRLNRRMEKQRHESAQTGTSTQQPQNLERGVLGREMTGLNDPASVTITSSRRRLSQASKEADLKGKQPEDRAATPGSNQRSPTPLDNFYRTNSGLGESPEQQERDTASVRPVSRNKSKSPSIVGFMRSRKSTSNSPKPSKPDAPNALATSGSPSRTNGDYAESAARTSESGSTRPWLSFFKWGARRRRRSSAGPGSFSNTSRDSMQAAHVGGPPPVISFANGRKLSTGIPKRTMSRFREDLPEHPMSPPDSRVGSPDAEMLSSDPLPQIADDMETAEYRNNEVRALPIPILARRQDSQPSPAPHSMSLASIDSEGSWLSGRVSRQSRQRASSGALGSPTAHMIRSPSALSEVQNSDHTDDESITADEYLNKVVPNTRREPSAGQAHASSDDESAFEAQWGTVSRKPTVVRGAANKRSREGLLVQTMTDKQLEGSITEMDNTYIPSAEHTPLRDTQSALARATRKKDLEQGVFDSDEADSPISPESPLPQRATSVNLGRGHSRNFSAGSAKLLEISPRPSGDGRFKIERAEQ